MFVSLFVPPPHVDAHPTLRISVKTFSTLRFESNKIIKNKGVVV